MFQTCPVKTRKTAANSTPRSLLGKMRHQGQHRPGRNPNTGTHCKISSSGISTFSADVVLGGPVAVGQGEDQGEHIGQHAPAKG